MKFNRVVDKRDQATVIPTYPPKDLQEFSTTCIFDAPEDFPKPIAPLGPFVTSDKIKLTNSEKKLLSKDPKYSLVFPPTKMKLAIEIERMNAKIRFNSGRKRRNEKKGGSSSSSSTLQECRVLNSEKNRITDKNGNPIEWVKCKEKKCSTDLLQPEGGETADITEDLKKLLVDDHLIELYSECKDRYIYEPVKNCIDFGARRATDYKLNRSVILPKPMDSERELQCELRRTSYLKAFEEYIKDVEGTPEDKVKFERKNTKLETKRGVGEKFKKVKKLKPEFKKVRKRTKAAIDPINLSVEEVKALKSLKDKVKEGEIVVCPTDKSSRFAVLTKQQYLESGKTHTNKDKEVGWKEVRYMQTQINGHVWWISHILGYGNKIDPSRMLRNLQNHSLEVPEMNLLVKDHKTWCQESNSPVPSRPVVSGNKGVNTHLSEILSEFLEPLILELGGGEVTSTEEALYMITEANKCMKAGLLPEQMNILGKCRKDTDSGPPKMDGIRSVGIDGMNKDLPEGEGSTPTPY